MSPRGRASLRRLRSSRNRARVRLCRRLCCERRRVRRRQGKERRNEHDTRSAARSHAISDHQDHPEAIARHRLRRERDRALPRLYEPDRLLPRIPALIHGLVGRMPWVDGHRHGPSHDRRWMGHGDPAHPRRLHAHVAAADPAVHSFALCRAEALSVGDAPRFHHRSTHPRTPGKTLLYSAGLPELPRLRDPRRDLLCDLVRAAVPAQQVFLRARPSAFRRHQRALQDSKRPRDHPLHAHHFVRRDRLGHVAQPELGLDHLWPPVRSGPVGGGSLLCHCHRAHSLQLSAHVGSIAASFVHDHGNFLLAFVMVWAYFSFSQWLIIWAGNLPEEITWYFRRLHGGWQFVGLFLIVFHFFVPFFMLLSRSFKRDITRLVWLASWMLVARYIDLFWHIEPSFSETFTVTLADLVIPFAMGGLWIAYFCHNLSSRPLVPAYDATAQDVLEPAHE